MKPHRANCFCLRLCIVIMLPFLSAGCAGRSGEGNPPTPAQQQQQSSTIMNDPHVPDSIKQHYKDQQEANRAAAKGYTVEQQRKGSVTN